MVRDVSTLLDMTKGIHNAVRRVFACGTSLCHSERSRGISNYFLWHGTITSMSTSSQTSKRACSTLGWANDLALRITEHRAGEIPGFTADYRCSKLIYYEHCTDVREAIAREKQLKKWSRSKKVALIASLNPRWKDLAPEILGE